jgi:chemotaxis protein histidine kinase CheA
MMHVDPLQLVSFLDTAEVSLKLVNTILREPARTDAEFRKKLAGLFRELHSIKGEASALNLKSVATRVHALEDMVSECKQKPELTGNDFLPLVLRLDDLLAHLRSVREMAARLTTLRDTVPPAPPAAAEAGTNRRADDIGPTLRSLAERLAEDHVKPFRLTLLGLVDVPAPYTATIKDCIIQMLRNAAVHGIEPLDVRRPLGKEDVGTVTVDFHKAPDGFELIFEDDGAGMTPEALKGAAVKRGLISAEEAAGMDARTAMALIFRPGFSTQDEVSMDAGRGVGMDVVARSVYALGGKIGVSTKPGRYTRFKIVLPSTDSVSSTAVA